MRFSCEQSSLSKALGIVSKAVSVRTTIPVLKSILLEAREDGQLKMSASDLDLSIEKTIDVRVDEPGSIAVNAKLFMDIIRKMPAGNVDISINESGNVLIKSLNSEFNILGTPASDFPNIGELDGPQDTLSFDKDIFTEMIRKTGFCASVDETKGIIVGILMELEENVFNMVALDGFRMAIAREKMRNAQDKKIVINARILNEIYKIIMETGTEEDIKLILGEKKAVMLLERTKIVMRLLEGAFIKYRDILPKENKIFIKANRKDLMDAVERASLLSKSGRNNLIVCSINNNLMEITSNSEEGNVKEDLIIESEGGSLDIGFNSKYILDALKVIDDEEIKMEFNTGITPCLVRPVEGDRYEYLILPVRIPAR